MSRAYSRTILSRDVIVYIAGHVMYELRMSAADLFSLLWSIFWATSRNNAMDTMTATMAMMISCECVNRSFFLYWRLLAAGGHVWDVIWGHVCTMWWSREGCDMWGHVCVMWYVTLVAWYVTWWLWYVTWGLWCVTWRLWYDTWGYVL